MGGDIKFQPLRLLILFYVAPSFFGFREFAQALTVKKIVLSKQCAGVIQTSDPGASRFSSELNCDYGRNPLTTMELGVTLSDCEAATMPATAPPTPAIINAAIAPGLSPEAWLAVERRAHLGAV